MRYFFLLMIVVLFGCHQPEKKVVVKKTVSRAYSLRHVREENEKLSEKEHLDDSLKQDSALSKILSYAYAHINSPHFKTELNLWGDSDLFARLTFGNIFSPVKKHLIIQNRVNLYGFNENVYLLENSKFVNVIREKIPDLTFVIDSIADVNGDHQKDFLLNWYPESGCCARNVFNVYLYVPINGTFTKKYQVINPDFSPSEKIIRGVNYGHPGEVPLYKYKWNGAKIDTIEYIYPADTLKKKFYLVHHRGDQNDPQKRMVLSVVPKEYRKISGYDWFIDY
jgi:hypothetical protein